MNGRGLKASVALIVASIATVGWWTPVARAEFGPIELVSKSAKEQAAEAIAPAISGNGRYVAFAGRIGGRFGVFRKDLQTGAVRLVVEFTENEEVGRAAPSISASGEFVAFTTARRLDPRNDPEPSSRDVYVADMGTVPPTYELVSALNGCDPATSVTPCGLSYNSPVGAAAAGRVALSADGRRVVFVTRAESDLAGPGTPAGQVAVRDRETDRTYLITVKRGTSEPVPGGGADPEVPAAAISGDGSTIAWVGSRLPEQVPMLGDEEAAARAFEAEGGEPAAHQYHEPLWRRVPTALEPDPPTRRVVGGGDPLAAGCPPGGTLAVPACQGPFPDLLLKARALGERLETADGRGWGTGLPQLSSNGETVAFVGNPEEDNDLFVVDMAPGLSRREAVKRLTRWVDPIPASPTLEPAFTPQFGPFTGSIQECAISPDGNRIAFTTVRQIFPLSPPTLITPPPPGTSEVAELYQVDLRGQTIERVTPGRGGAVSLAPVGGSGAGSPSYSAEGRFLAFASGAFNLVEGDTNGASDAFVVESPPPASVEETSISPRPASLVVTPLWRMTVDAASLPNGLVLVTVGVPGAGKISAKATARLGRRLRFHRVASAHRGAAAAGVQKLELRLPHKLRHLAQRMGGLYGQLDIGFLGPAGKPPLHAALDARFLVHQPQKKAKR